MTDKTKEKALYFAYHTSAAGLILCAAQQSGLLKSVAEMLLANTKKDIPVGCLACELLEQLTGEFDKHTLLPALVWEDSFGEGIDMPLNPKEQLEPYLSKPALGEIPA